MTIKHYMISCMFAENRSDDDWWFKNWFIDLINLREGTEGIADSVNDIAEMVDETLYLDDESELFDACFKAFMEYTTR